MKACSRCGTVAEHDPGAERRVDRASASEPGSDGARAQQPGAQPPAEEVLPPGWSCETSERGILWTCQTCTRDNVRSIEAKLPEEWW